MIEKTGKKKRRSPSMIPERQIPRWVCLLVAAVLLTPVAVWAGWLLAGVAERLP